MHRSGTFLFTNKCTRPDSANPDKLRRAIDLMHTLANATLKKRQEDAQQDTI